MEGDSVQMTVIQEMGFILTKPPPSQK